MASSLNQWVPAITGAILGLVVIVYLAISTRRLDARIERERKKLAAQPRPEK
jgi:uncharacterized membrane protein